MILYFSQGQTALYQQSWVKLFLLGCSQFLSTPDLECIARYSRLSNSLLLTPHSELYRSDRLEAGELGGFLKAVQDLQLLRLTEREFALARSVILFRQVSKCLFSVHYEF